jgi:hypothetical protein
MAKSQPINTRHLNPNRPEARQSSFDAFLVIDAESFASYTTDSYAMPTGTGVPLLRGDFNPFVLAVNPDFQPHAIEARNEEHPGFTGEMRILTGLIWSDLFAMLTLQSANLEDLWPLAMEHPNQVYTGPIVPAQVEAWRRLNSGRMRLVKTFTDFVKQRMPEST